MSQSSNKQKIQQFPHLQKPRHPVRRGMGDVAAFLLASIISVLCVIGVFCVVFLTGTPAHNASHDPAPPAAPTTPATAPTTDSVTPPPPAATQPATAPQHTATPAIDPVTFRSGRSLFLKTCLTCHTPTGDGIPNMGVSLKTSTFVKQSSLDQIAALIKQGSLANTPTNHSGQSMPPNPLLNPRQLTALATYCKALSEGITDVPEEASTK